MAGGRACASCGGTGSLTREHEFGNWLSKLGLDTEPTETLAGHLNRIGRNAQAPRDLVATCRPHCQT